ncbi:hypothetical protein HMPREF9413_5710 [Paenibacillus sp. HGF7]|nr:hypothetical protein HMPREF9413_5710 [Paenibacillus sp. HGF7]
MSGCFFCFPGVLLLSHIPRPVTLLLTMTSSSSVGVRSVRFTVYCPGISE